MSCKIIKRVEIEEGLEEQVTEYQVFIEDTATNLMNMASASRDPTKATEDNVASMIRQVQEKNIEIAKLRVELELSKNVVVIDTSSFNNFLGYARTIEEELH